MKPESLSVVIPTVKGRGDVLAKAVASVAETAPISEIFIIPDLATCGEAWNIGVSESIYSGRSGFVLLFADDLYPAEDNWFYNGAATLAIGEIPCPILLEEGTGNRWNEGDGNAGNQYAFSRVPMLTLEMARQIFPIPPLHYYSDCWIGAKATSLGISSRVTEGYSFYHSWSQPGRINDSESDRQLYEWESGRL